MRVRPPSPSRPWLQQACRWGAWRQLRCSTPPLTTSQLLCACWDLHMHHQAPCEQAPGRRCLVLTAERLPPTRPHQRQLALITRNIPCRATMAGGLAWSLNCTPYRSGSSRLDGLTILFPRACAGAAVAHARQACSICRGPHQGCQELQCCVKHAAAPPDTAFPNKH